MKPVLVRLLLLSSIALCATPALALRYVPFAGVEGYQEIQVAPDLFFVAFQASRGATSDELASAWRARSAELCVAAGFSGFVPMKYPFEPVKKDDKPLVSRWRDPADDALMYAGGAVYIPIFTPRATGPNPTHDAPSTLGHVRCAKDPSELIRPERFISAEPAISYAKTQGWIAPRAAK